MVEKAHFISKLDDKKRWLIEELKALSVEATSYNDYAKEFEHYMR